MIVLGIIFDKNKNRPKLSGKAIAVSLKDSIFELLLPVIICVTLFSGFDIFEVASIAVLYTILLTTVIRKDFSLRGVAREIADSVPVSGGVLFIIAAASCLSVYMALSGIPENVTEFITQYVPNKYVFLLLMNIVLLITGCLLDLCSRNAVRYSCCTDKCYLPYEPFNRILDTTCRNGLVHFILCIQ